MKRVNIRKIAAIFMAIIMVSALSACGAANNQTPAGTVSDSSSLNTTASTTANTTAENIDPLGKYTPAITLTACEAINIGTKYDNGDTHDNNIWTREYESALGIKIKYAWTIDALGTNYQQKLNMYIAANDLPDIIPCDNTTFRKLVDADMVADLTDVYNKYASDVFKTESANFQEGTDSAKFNGRLMGIPSLGCAAAGAKVLWLRDDWMKKLNLQVPKTYSDLVAIMEAFVTKDPDGNGKADTLGYPLSKEFFAGYSDLSGIFNAYHAYADCWIKDSSGKLVYSMIQPEVKNALKAAQDLYKKGLIDKEFGVKDATKSAEDFAKDKYGVNFGCNWNGYLPYADLLKNNKNATWTPYPLVSADNNPAITSAGWPISVYYVVNKKCKYPEAAIKMANLLIEKTVGKTSVTDYEKLISPPNGTPYYIYPLIKAWPPNSNLSNAQQIHDAFAAKDDSKVTSATALSNYKMAKAWIEKGDPTGFGFYVQAEAFYMLMGMQDKGQLIIDAKHGSDTETQAKLGPTLKSDMMTVFTNIIMGDPIDNFDKWVANWKTMGGDKITEEINTEYGAK